MSTDEVLLDLNEAENILEQLSILYQALTAIDAPPKDLKQVWRGMIKLKVAILTTKLKGCSK